MSFKDRLTGVRVKKFFKKVPILGTLARGGYAFYKCEKGKLRLKQAVNNPPVKIVVGSSGVFEDSWVPTDIQFLNLVNPDHWKRYFNENSIDAILSEHVWEHLTRGEGYIAAQHCFKYLKPGCYVRVAVPDGYHPDPEYIEWVKVGGTGAGADDHKVLYNHETFSELFERAGFQVRLLEYFDRDGKFNYTDWNPDKGMIHRSKRFDKRNKGGELKYTSIVMDAIKVS